MFCDSSSPSNLPCKLAARKLVSALSSRPEELLRYLNKESSIFSKTADPSVLAALRILHLFYEQVKSEVSVASNTNACDSNVLRFLQSADNETCQHLIAKYANELSPQHWGEINVNARSPRRRVPATVPRLSRNLDENAESDDSSSILTQKSSDDERRTKVRQIVEVVRSSSSSSSSMDLNAKPSNHSNKSNKSNKSNTNRVNQLRQQVDRSCSPFDLFGMDPIELPKSQPTSSSKRQSNRVEEDPISLISAAVQTDAIKVDASTRTHFTNNSSLTSTPNSTDKTSTSKTSSSMISSEHSLGQVSFQRAEFLTSRSNFRIVTIRRDGSIYPTLNMSAPLDHSTPVRQTTNRTTVRDLSPQEVQEGTQQRTNNLAYLQQMMGSSSESPLVAQEQSIRSWSAGSHTQVSEVIEDLPVDEEEVATEEDVSTLNQISPLPTG